MNFIADSKKYEMLARLSQTSLFIILGSNIALLAVAYILFQSDIPPAFIRNVVLRNTLFVIAVLELPAIHFVKQSLITGLPADNNGDQFLFKRLFFVNLVITAMCAVISVYGLVIFAIGGEFRILLLFIAISLIGYQIFRIRGKDIDRLTDRQNGG